MQDHIKSTSTCTRRMATAEAEESAVIPAMHSPQEMQKACLSTTRTSASVHTPSVHCKNKNSGVNNSLCVTEPPLILVRQQAMMPRNPEALQCRHLQHSLKTDCTQASAVKLMQRPSQPRFFISWKFLASAGTSIDMWDLGL